MAMSTDNWLYGDAGDLYPIQPGETWVADGQGTCGTVLCQDLFNDAVLEYITTLPPVDLIYVDPPWNTGLLKGFRTKAKKPLDGQDIHTFLTRMLKVCQHINAKVNYVEIGKQHINDLIQWVEYAGGIVSGKWDITYYNTKPSHLIRFQWDTGNITDAPFDFTGLDDEHTPGIAMEQEDCETVMDVCTGRGLTGRTAFKKRKLFYGIELNHRRLANLLKWYNEQGLKVFKVETRK